MRRLGAACALVLLLVPALGLIARKCCHQDQKLRLLNATSVECVPATGHQLFSHFFASHAVVYGIPPACPDPELVDLSEKYFVTCVDVAGDTPVGLHCAQLPNYITPAPRVDTLKKCCPQFRRYNTARQTCWAGLHSPTATSELLRVVFSNFTSGFADLSFGPPECATGDVLVDLVVPRTRVWFQDSGSLLVHPLGVAHPTLIVPESMCVDLADDSESVVVRTCQDYRVVCQLNRKPCVRKCCRDGESLFGARCERSQHVADLQLHKVHGRDRMPIPVPSARPAFSYGLGCQKYPLNPYEDDADQNFLLLNDSLFLPYSSQVVPSERYCVEHVVSHSDELNGTHAFVCFGEYFLAETSSWLVTSPLYIGIFVLMIMSCVCLLLTFLVYMCIPFLHGSLHGKTLMSHIAALLVAFVCLTILQNETNGTKKGTFLSNEACTILGYLLHYTFLSAFFWLNVISFDIWWTFGTIRPFISKKADERRRFIFYSIYGWGFSALLTSVTIFADTHPNLIPRVLRPEMGTISCFLSTRTYGLLVFFCVPVSIAFSMNITLFILTANYCYKTKSRLEKLAVTDPAKKKYKTDKNKLIVMGKLIVMMGLTWAVEVISRLELLPLQAWYLCDLVNALQGFLIFITFVLKPRVLSSLANRLRSHQPSTSTMFTTAASDSRINHSGRSSSRASQ
ncbi:unnamed protein product [Bemisia tabaci]|uniref:G-protein coupled receptors family 2 profile 2 domain-containing protein n=1 Tax=Bemisia tabaci TaxID=7038 RepID=A0A9P0F3E7_BEMTA|nr:unnamed protein product [Bemisia tabaci]